jgi:hypothetical protein
MLDRRGNYPEKSYLLNPDSIYATSYEKLSNDKAKIHIGYKRTWIGYVKETMRMNYNQIIMGSLLCENVIDIEELAYVPKSKIEIPFLSKTKKITFQVQKTKSVSIKCKRIFIEAIDIYVMQDHKIILNSEFRENIRKSRGG